MNHPDYSSHARSWKSQQQQLAAQSSIQQADVDQLKSLLARRVIDHFNAEILPEIQRAVDQLRQEGLSVFSTINLESFGGDHPWSGAACATLEISLPDGRREVHQISFLGETLEDHWRVRSYAISSSANVRAAVPDAIFVPGSANLSDFVASRLMLLIKSAFPILP